MESRDRGPNCCEVIGLILYSLFRIFLVVCPIVAQIRCIYILCKPEDYLKSPDKCTRVTSHIELLIGLYIVFYVAIYFVYLLAMFLIDNWSNEAQPCKMHTAQLIGGLVVFKLYYQLWRLGHRCVYGQDSNCGKEFFGTVLLTILTLGTYLIYRYFEVTINNWNSQNSCKRETVRFVAGIGVFYCYYHLWRIGIRRLYHPDSTLGDKTLGTFLLTLVTFGLFIPFRIVQVICRNWNNADPCARETSRFFGGIGIFYLYYQLWNYGIKWTYREEGCCKQFTGHLMLTLASFFLFIPFRIVELIGKNWYHDDKCTRQTVRFIGGLGIFYLYYHLWRVGINYVYHPEFSGCKQFTGHCMLTLVTVGLFIPFRIIDLICRNWSNEDSCKRETARFFGGLGIFYIYYQLWHYGLKWTYREEESCGKQFVGHVFLSLATVALFIPFRIVEAVCRNWNSETVWKRELARCVGLLVIFYIWYKMASTGYDSVYRSDEQQAQHREHTNQVFGHALLILTSFGTYIIYKPFELIVKHWYDENSCKRETARFFGGLGVFYIYYQIFYHGILWVYKENENTCKFITGNLFLVLTSAGVYIPFRIVQLIIRKWDSPDICHRQTARFAGTLVIGYLWYRMLLQGYDWVYHESRWYQTVLGYVFMTICTLGIFIPVQLFIRGIQHTYQSHGNTCVQICGHIELTIVTCGLFLIFRFFQAICNNWSSGTPWKKHTARAIVGLVVIYLWIIALIWSFYMIYRQRVLWRNIVGRMLMTVCTLGIYLPVMMVEYLIHMCRCISEHYFLARDYVTGVIMASVLTGGLFGLFTMARMENRLARYTSNLLLAVMNAAGVYYLYTLVIMRIALKQEYKLAILVSLGIASYPFIKFMAEFVIFNAVIRRILKGSGRGLTYAALAFKFCMAKIGFPFYVMGIGIRNGMSRMGARMSTFGSRIYAQSANRRWIWTGYYFRIDRLQPDDPGYYAPVVHEPTIREPEPFVGWDERQAIRVNQPKYILDEKRRNHQYVMDCVAGNVKFNFNKVLHKYSKASVELWFDRYMELRDTLASKAFYERLVDVSLDNPQNWRRVDAVISRLQHRRKDIVDEPIEYFNRVEVDGAFEISAD